MVQKREEFRAGRMTYALVTPARNEALYIERTILSVAAQSIKPIRWVIVSDGSNDGTDEIVKKHAADHPWIELLRMPERSERHFGGKAIAFNAGAERARFYNPDIIGNLDADITFDSEYFEFLLKEFSQDPLLGVAGTPFNQGSVQYDYRFSRKEHVSGACQLFRRECLEMVGGYIPLKGGGIDLTAVVTARMKGWRTETFTGKSCVHLRPMGKAGPHYLKYSFRSGFGDYLLGVHPAWQFFRSIYQMSSKPLFLSGLMLLSGYSWAMTIRARKPVSEEFVRFRRKEQLNWLRDYRRRALSGLS